MIPAPLLEALAAIEHDRWAHWQRYMHSKCERNVDGSITIPPELVTHWEQQIATPYADLTAREQAMDRAEVERYWPTIAQYFTEQRAE